MSSSECTVAVEVTVQLSEGKTEDLQLSYSLDEASEKAAADLLDYVAKECFQKYGPVEPVDIMIWDAPSDGYVASNNNADLKHLQLYRVTVKTVGHSSTNAQSDVTVVSSNDQKNTSTFECSICCNEGPLDGGVGCQAADQLASEKNKHMFCRECITRYVSVATMELPLAKDLDGVRCMSSGCEQSICTANLRKFVSAHMAEALQARCTNELLMHLSNVERCKTEDCFYAVEIDFTTQQMQYFDCQQCLSVFCRSCKRDKLDHNGFTCAQMQEKERLDAERQQEAVENAKRAEVNKLSKDLDEAKIRKCPGCAKSELKNIGDGSCNKMICMCGTKYCYLCMATGIGYEHFSDTGCPLFGDAEEFDRKRLAHLQEKLDALVVDEKEDA